MGAHTYKGEYLQSNTLWDGDKLNQPTYANGSFSLYNFHGTWDHLEKARVPDIGVVMLKSKRRDGVLLVGGVVWLDFNAWG
jgi:hypothetical protein